jgi:hypothetical protein
MKKQGNYSKAHGPFYGLREKLAENKSKRRSHAEEKKIEKREQKAYKKSQQRIKVTPDKRLKRSARHKKRVHRESGN